MNPALGRGFLCPGERDLGLSCKTKKWARTALAALGVFACSQAIAGPLQLVKDINRSAFAATGDAVPFRSGYLLSLCTNTGSGCGAWFSDASGFRHLSDSAGSPYQGTNFAVVGNTAYFVTDDEKLQKTDGTFAGTQTVNTPFLPWQGMPIAVLRDEIYVRSVDTSLWKVDGAGSATKLVTPSPGAASGWVATLGGRVVYVTGLEVWTTDGTLAGTQRLLAVPATNGGYQLTDFTVAGDKLYFVDDDATLWVTDGTSAGSTIVFSFGADVGFSAGTVPPLVPMGGKLYFAYWQSGDSPIIFATDGSPGGPVVVKQLWDSTQAIKLAASASHLYFMLQEWDQTRLWWSDGTGAGTVPLLPFTRNAELARSAFSGDDAYLNVVASFGDTAGDIWRTNGTTFNPLGGPYEIAGMMGTSVLLNDGGGAWIYDDSADVVTKLAVAAGEPSNSSACYNGAGFVSDAAALNGIVYFAANDGILGCELWKTDGTSAGTLLMKDTLEGPDGGVLGGFGTGSGVVFFNATDGTLPSVWRTDGTGAGTYKVIDGQKATRFFETPTGTLIATGDCAYSPESLWKSDGTVAGTALLAETGSACAANAPDFAQLGSTTFFVSASGPALWKTDGSSAGTQKVKTFDYDFGAKSLTAFGGALFFTGRTASTGYELWRSDGTDAGTQLVVDMISGPSSGVSTILGVVNDEMIVGGAAIWATDGSAGGMRLVADYSVDEGTRAKRIGDRLYFPSGYSGFAVTDGTAEGTGYVTSTASMPMGAGDTAFYLAAMTDPGAYQVVSRVAFTSGGQASARVLDAFDVSYYGALLAPTSTGMVLLASDPRAGIEPYFFAFDSVPDPVTFPSASNALINSFASSAALIEGLNVATTVSASGGEFCVSRTNQCDCDIEPYGTTGSVNIGEYLCVRHPTAATPSTTTTTNLSIGGVAASFSSVTTANPGTVIVFGQPQFEVSEVGTLSIPVYRTGSWSEPVSVRWTTANGLATAGTNFGAAGNTSQLTGILSWAAGDGTPKFIQVGGSDVPLLDDGTIYDNRGFNIGLSEAAGGAALGALNVASVLIRNENGLFSFSGPLISMPEGGYAQYLRVVRLGNTDSAASVSFRTIDDTAIAGEDYGVPGSAAPITGTLDFVPGQRERVIVIGPPSAVGPNIPIIDDAIAEPTERFIVELFNPTNGAIVDPVPRTYVSITSDERAVGFEVQSVEFAENGSSAYLNVLRFGNKQIEASVNYATSNGTALAGTHYTATSGTLNWGYFDDAPKQIVIPLKNDALVNGDRTFTVTLSSPVNATVVRGTATVKILDDENTVQFSAATATAKEGVSPLTLTIVRAGSTGIPASVSWAAQNDTAIAGVDFAPSSGYVTWGPGDSSPKTINIPILNDTTPEATKRFKVTLSGPIGSTLGTNKTVIVTLTDDDNGVGFVQPAYSVPENGRVATLQVTRGAGPAGTVRWTTVNGTAVAGQDYGVKGSSTQMSGTVSWLLNETTPKTISIPILQDTLSEGAETFTVVLSSPSTGLTLGSVATATVTITDDDIPTESRVSFVQPKTLVLENAGSAFVTVHRGAVGSGFTVPLTVSYATAAGTALATTDFTMRTGTLTWTDSDSADKTISIPIVNNTVAESPKWFKVVLSNPTPGLGFGSPAETQVTILDDDEAFPAHGAIPDGWTVPVDAAAGWHVSNDAGAYEGVFSLRSDAIDDGQVAQVEVTRLFAAGTISFRAKVSSEAGFDALRFYIDGEVKGTWSGTAVAGWQLFSAPITAGTHTLRWSYEKDGSASMGQDAAWIDAVTMP